MRWLPQERCWQEFVAGSDAETGSNHLPLPWIRTAKLRVASSVTSETRIVAIMR
jgi:hypothetical protein